MDYLRLPARNLDWVLNTPERNEILNQGPPENAQFNILGKGAFGTVFKAIFKNRPVALKIVKNRSGVNKTENEANILGFNHRNIVRILKIESTVKFGIIIMEHFPSQSLQSVLETMELPLAHRILITLDILNALSFCHKRSLLHLDVKPQNVLVAFKKVKVQRCAETTIFEGKNRHYICKLCDFGSSLKIDLQDSIKKSTNGTVRYMAPEALRGEELNSAADIYSLGITMWQLEKRRLPYEAISCNEVVAFQVVKHNLRPNLDLSRFCVPRLMLLSPNPGNKRCKCQHFTTESLNVLKNKIKLGNLDAKPLKRGCHTARKEISLTLSISPNPRSGSTVAILQSNGRNKVVRNLNKEWELSDKINNIDDYGSEKLVNIFCETILWQNDVIKRKEKHFTFLYESCWHKEAQKRPHSSYLKRQLVQLLK